MCNHLIAEETLKMPHTKIQSSVVELMLFPEKRRIMQTFNLTLQFSCYRLFRNGPRTAKITQLDIKIWPTGSMTCILCCLDVLLL